jgi:hypothetical protein
MTHLTRTHKGDNKFDPSKFGVFRIPCPNMLAGYRTSRSTAKRSTRVKAGARRLAATIGSVHDVN